MTRRAITLRLVASLVLGLLAWQEHRIDTLERRVSDQPPERIVHHTVTRDVSLPARASRSHPRRPLPMNPTPRFIGTPDFAALAQCESSGNPRAVSPSGRYEGLFQFDLATWRSVGGTGHPKDATPAEQTKRARLLYAQRGRSPWPICGRHL